MRCKFEWAQRWMQKSLPLWRFISNYFALFGEWSLCVFVLHRCLSDWCAGHSLLLSAAVCRPSALLYEDLEDSFDLRFTYPSKRSSVVGDRSSCSISCKLDPGRWSLAGNLCWLMFFCVFFLSSLQWHTMCCVGGIFSFQLYKLGAGNTKWSTVQHWPFATRPWGNYMF